MEAREQLAGHRQPVAAVVPFAAQHHDALRRKRCETVRQELHHAMGRVLHQDQAGNPHFHGPAVRFAHLRRGEDSHIRRATTMVISSCNSPAPVHWTTASMERAIISDESTRAYFTSNSCKRSSPNISP